MEAHVCVEYPEWEDTSDEEDEEEFQEWLKACAAATSLERLKEVKAEILSDEYSCHLPTWSKPQPYVAGGILELCSC